MQMLPREVILALVLVDLPINLDVQNDTALREGFGASWWYLACDSDDYFVDIVEEVVSLCSFAQVRALSLQTAVTADVLLTRATPKCRNVLSKALRFVGRYEFVDRSPVYSDENDGAKAFNALDFGTFIDPTTDGRRVVLKCYTKEAPFLNDVSYTFRHRFLIRVNVWPSCCSRCCHFSDCHFV